MADRGDLRARKNIAQGRTRPRGVLGIVDEDLTGFTVTRVDQDSVNDGHAG